MKKKKLDMLTKAKLIYSGELLIFAIVFLVFGILRIIWNVKHLLRLRESIMALKMMPCFECIKMNRQQIPIRNESLWHYQFSFIITSHIFSCRVVDIF